jgi:hypothetical protein
MRQLEELKTLWKKKQDEVGALRLQSSDGDCVPTTVINALLYLTEDRIHPKLQRLIWSVALDDQGETTGWIGCQLVSDVINAWRVQAGNDGIDEPVVFESRINAGKKNLLQDVQDVVNKKGVACLTCKKGKHYALLHSFDGENFYGFDPYLPNEKDLQDKFFTHIEILSATSSETVHKKINGMVNFSISIPQLEGLLKVKRNQWIHLIEYPQNPKKKMS